MTLPPSPACHAPRIHQAQRPVNRCAININLRPGGYRPLLIGYKQQCGVTFPTRCLSQLRLKCLTGQASALAPSFGAPTPTARFHAIDLTRFAADNMPLYETYICPAAVPPAPARLPRAVALFTARSDISFARTARCMQASCVGVIGFPADATVAMIACGGGLTVIADTQHRAWSAAAGGRHAPAALRSILAPAKCQFCSERRVCCVWVRPLRATAVYRCLVRVGLQQPGAARRQRPPPPFFPHA